MQITQYVKEHPWATGIIVVVGGFIFLMIFRGGSGSEGTGGNAAGPSDAEIAANAQIQSAQIAATAQAQQAGAAVQAAQIGANVQMNSDNKAAEVYMTQITAAKELGLSQISNDSYIANAAIQADAQVRQTVAMQATNLNKKTKDQSRDILQTVVSGQNSSVAQNQSIRYSYPMAGNTAGGIIGSIGGLASSLGSIFSDQRLKQNIRFLGYDSKGLEVYEWNYKGSKKKHVGYIAQSVVRSHPEAISIDPGSGYWKVDMYELASI